MTTARDKFGILLCGKKELMERVRKLIVASDEIHLQFASTPKFLTGRVMFRVPHIVLLDASFDRELLVEVLGTFRPQFPHVPVFAIATSADHRDVVELMKCGTTDYYRFPEDCKRLADDVRERLDGWRIERSQKRFLQLQQRAYNFNQIIGNSPSLIEVLARAKKVIENPTLTVLITGETGTGKELLARAIHYNGSSSSSPFVDIACSALPETLLESELFGFEKGAFTDAREKKVGLFELAGDGSIFLDEIGDITLAMQSKLLKVIESRTMRRLGGLQDIAVRARIIAATSVDFESKVKAGGFRKDLYHRLNIMPLQIPALRERKEDIPMLVKTFIDLFNKLYSKKIKSVTPEVMQLLMEHEWEGNIRELKHSIERAVLLEEQDCLDGRDFEFVTNSRHGGQGPAKGKHIDTEAMAPEHDFSLVVPLNEASIEEVQRKFALKVLEFVRGNKRKAAYILRVSRPRLDRILKNGSE